MGNIFQELDHIRVKTNLCIKSKEYKASLLGDLGGLTLFSFYYGKEFNDTISLDNGAKLTDDIILNIRNSLKRSDIRYSSGLTGFAWLLKFLHKEDFIEFEANDVLCDLDEIIYNYAFKELDKGNYDFLHGAGGAIYYFLIGTDTLNDYAKSLISKLHSIAEFTPQGRLYWPFFSVDDYHKLDKHINFGLAHGQPAIISILSEAFKLDQSNIILKHLIEDAAKTILDYKYKDRNSLYPSTEPVLRKSNYYSKGSRLGWCYGDLGIALSLWEVGAILNNSLLQKEALECLKKSTFRKNLDDTFVKDAALCHGSAGIMNIFNKFNILTETELYNEEVEYWKNISLKLLNTETDKFATGHCAWNNKNEYYNDFSLLQGISGVGLSFLSLINPDINWGRALLM